MEWYHVWWPRRTSKRVTRFVSDSWVSCLDCHVIFSSYFVQASENGRCFFPLLCRMSFSHDPSCIIRVPKYVNSFTCSNLTFSIFMSTISTSSLLIAITLVFFLYWSSIRVSCWSHELPLLCPVDLDFIQPRPLLRGRGWPL